MSKFPTAESTELTAKEQAFEQLAELDEQLDGLMPDLDSRYDERDKEIVGLQREKTENISDTATTRKPLSVQQKVERELAYVTEALDLDPYQ